MRNAREPLLSFDEVVAFLRANSALIVHFSGTPKGGGRAGSPHFFPADLQNVIAGGAMGGLSCSLIRPGDSFHGQSAHSTGTVGLILSPNSILSIVAVSPGDVGSHVGDEGVRYAPDKDIDRAALEGSLFQRSADRYNEWVVRDFHVLGVFVAEPASVARAVELKLPPEAAAYLQQGTIEDIVDITIDQIVSHLGSLSVYTFQDSRIRKYECGRWQDATHMDIYPDPERRAC